MLVNSKAFDLTFFPLRAFVVNQLLILKDNFNEQLQRVAFQYFAQYFVLKAGKFTIVFFTVFNILVNYKFPLNEALNHNQSLRRFVAFL